MRTADDAIAAVASWDGTAEYPAGSNKNWLTDWYGMGPVAWCAITMSRTLIAAGFGTTERIFVPGVETTSAKGWAYVPYVEEDFRAAGRWYYDNPLPGDLVIFDWDADQWGDHVGMVASVEDDGSIYSWEGNTDEGVIRLKHRSRTYVRGFARPPYLDPIPQPVQEDEEMFTYSTAPDVDGGSIWFVVSGVAHRLHLPDDADRINKAGIVSLGEMSAAFHGVFDHRG